MERGDFVTINYISRIKDTNKVFDTTFEEVAKREGIHRDNATFGPVTIVLGAAHVIPGLEKCLLDMDVGDEKEVDIEPEDAFGPRNRSRITTVLMRDFRRHGVLPRPGMRIEINNRWATVRSVSSGRVILDFNHPLAGKTLHYTVQLLKKVDSTKEKIEAVLKLLGVRGEVTEDGESFSINLQVRRGTEEKVQKIVRKEIKKFIPDASISFS